jgi:hypothetical protein
MPFQTHWQISFRIESGFVFVSTHCVIHQPESESESESESVSPLHAHTDQSLTGLVVQFIVRIIIVNFCFPSLLVPLRFVQRIRNAWPTLCLTCAIVGRVARRRPAWPLEYVCVCLYVCVRKYLEPGLCHC